MHGVKTDGVAVQTLLLQKLRDPELRGETTREVWGDEIAVMPQHKLLEAYFADQIDRCVHGPLKVLVLAVACPRYHYCTACLPVMGCLTGARVGRPVTMTC